MTLGERLQNPGNIRISSQHWLGKIMPSSDPDFEEFDSVEHGVRAMAKILLTYFSEGINTIEKIVEKWAPHSDNNPTAAYIQNVCDRTGFNADEQLMMTMMEDLKAVVSAMIDQEQGGIIYSDEQITAGCHMALGDPI